ncbi:MAG TPA: thioredoxin domain-containing protein [Candidatus Baltobacteraceae bacterium]|nr:thioredoxin domain-containing protein [Candidatus Baltobacteraceae bacterium]
MHWKRHLFVLLAAAVGFGILAAFWSSAMKPAPKPTAEAETPAPPSITAPFVTVVDPSKGPKDAPVTIVEFGDHACPYCKSTQASVDFLMSAHPDKIRFVWKSAPSPLHPGSETAAEAALCAHRQGKFWEYHAKLFEDPSMTDQSSMVILADELGLDAAAFGDCLSTGATHPLVERTVTEARALGVTGIPTIFINDKRYEGALTNDELLEATGL